MSEDNMKALPDDVNAPRNNLPAKTGKGADVAFRPEREPFIIEGEATRVTDADKLLSADKAEAAKKPSMLRRAFNFVASHKKLTLATIVLAAAGHQYMQGQEETKQAQKATESQFLNLMASLPSAPKTRVDAATGVVSYTDGDIKIQGKTAEGTICVETQEYPQNCHAPQIREEQNFMASAKKIATEAKNGRPYMGGIDQSLATKIKSLRPKPNS